MKHAAWQFAGEGSGMSNASPRLPKPSRFLLLAEMRAGLECGITLASAPALLTAPRGDGHAVLVLPGFLASDISTALLRRYLALLNYQAHPWKLGRNTAGVDRAPPCGSGSPRFAKRAGARSA